MLPCFFVFLLAQGSLGEGAKDFGGNVLADCDDGSGLTSSIVRRGSEIACKKSRSLPLEQILSSYIHEHEVGLRWIWRLLRNEADATSLFR